MRLIFCADPLHPRRPDEAYAAEVSAAEGLGLEYGLISYEALVNENNPDKAVARMPESHRGQTACYRGWMLTPDQYSRLYEALVRKGWNLINDPGAYRRCHYLPESYPVIEPHTPKSVWLRTGGDIDMDDVMDLIAPFGSKPIVIKDFVKSQKHYWTEACFIPSASDRETVERVVRRFLELQGEYLNEGLVFREFVEFEPLARHSKSGMPLTKEFRLFFLDGKLLQAVEYWEQGDYGGITAPIEQFQNVAKSIKSRFFTMDVAKRKNGEWMIVELGDAQVSGLPETASAQDFYQSLAERWPDGGK